MGMFRKAKRETKGADMDPGLEKMMELEKLVRLKARLPTREDIAKAFADFFNAKWNARAAVKDNQAKLALQSLRYCEEARTKSATGESVHMIDNATMKIAGKALSLGPMSSKQTAPEHVDLARMIYERLKSGPIGEEYYGTTALVRQLTSMHRLAEAQNVVLTYEQRHPTAPPGDRSGAVVQTADDEELGLSPMAKGETHSRDVNLRKLWAWLLEGSVASGDDAEVLRMINGIRERGLLHGLLISGIILRYCLGRDDVEGTKRWWRAYLEPLRYQGSFATFSDEQAAPMRQALRWCLTSAQFEIGHNMVRDLMQANPPKLVWDIIFVWAAGTGKGVDEVGRMIDVMERSNEAIQDEEQWRKADISTINSLVEYATSKDDPYMAERFIALGRDRGIDPNAKTYVLQMAYRLRVNDIDGALIAYKNLQTMDLSSDEDVPVVNQLIVALCSSKRHDFDTVMNVAADLSDRRARFEPLTVATLTLLHLDRDEFHDVIDLLNTHAFHYSSAERAVVRDKIVAYCLDTNTPVARSWDAYSIIRNVFDELSREPRTQLMTSFFARDRPDMAVHVFNHMRGHSRADTMPTVNTYVTAFMGAAKRRDLESLEVLHNQLKLDFNVTPTTHLRNALLIAYTSCGRPRKALQFWDDIVASKEGPNYNSIHIALRACERSPFGDLKAREIWVKLRKMNIELDTTMWASYVAALAGNGNTEDAVRVLEEADRKGEVEVDAFVIGSLFMGSPGMDKQNLVEAWAKSKYPVQWRDLQKMGVQEAEDGLRAFGIDRSVTP